MIHNLCYNDLSWTTNEWFHRNPSSLWYNGFLKRGKSLLLLNLYGMKSHILHSDFEDDSSAYRLHKIERDQCIFLRNVEESEVYHNNLNSTFRIDYRNIPNNQCVLCSDREWPNWWPSNQYIIFLIIDEQFRKYELFSHRYDS